MLKLFKTTFIVLALVTFANASNKISDEQIKEIEALRLFQGAQIKVSQGYDAENMYILNVTVRGQASKIYLTKDKKYLISGDVIDTSNGKPLEAPVDLAPTIGKEAFTFGTGKDEYVLFTDPECPYCKKFESYFSQIEDKVKMRVFFYPLDFHKDAKDISIYIMSQDTYKDKIHAMTTTKAETPAFINRKIDEKELAKLQKDLDNQMEIGRKLGITGTPSVFDKEGNKVSWAALLQSYGIVVQ